VKKGGIPWLPVILGAILLAWIALRLAQPILDADVFWQMAYAKQMIARHTLRVDHTLYSWMPSSNQMIYCAWLSEFLLLGLWNWMGLAGLALLRYSGVLLTVALMARYAWRIGLLRRPLAWVLILFATMGGLVASQPKPELFSLVMWHALLFCYFGFRLAVRENEDPGRWLYAVPALMLLWVNLHGGFILAAPFLVVTLAAEWLPAWMRSGSVTPSLRNKMTLAWAGALLAVAVTPYGPRYPLQLFGDYVLHRTPRPDGVWNSAHQSALSDAGFHMHLPEFLVFMALAWMVLLAIAARRGPVDWLIPALNLIYAPLYVIYLRSSFLLPILFAYSVLWMAGQWGRQEATESRANQTPGWVPHALKGAMVLLFLFWIGRSVYDDRVDPQTYSWTGFGYSYFLPVAETEYLARANLGPRVYNLFDSGGYLLWRLYPQYLVMTDSRSFPYLSWFSELYSFTRQDGIEDFLKFLDRHPAKVALIDLKEQLVWRNFLRAPGWYPAYYGPSAAVFVKAKNPEVTGVAASVMTIRNAEAAFHVFDYAVALADFRTAWAALDQLNGALRVSANPARLAADLQYREAHAALRAKDYAHAEQLFMTALQGKTVGDRDALILTLLRTLREAAAMNPAPNVDQIPPALQKLAAPDMMKAH
jgi:hypothetical protein